MDVPQPPADQELRNIIDKLAQFVARNGPEFEQMTKLKQKDNPKFSFLFGGEHFNYYQYQVSTLQAAMKQKEVPMTMPQGMMMTTSTPTLGTPTLGTPTMGTPTIGAPTLGNPTMATPPRPWQASLPPVAAVAQIQQQIQELQDQIRQSEQNLAAQQQVLLQQQQVQLDEAIRKAQDDKLTNLAKECDIDVTEFDKVLQPIIESCTKDAISSGKGWIFSHSTTPERNELICQYLLKKVTVPGAAFDMKLHIVYLINDVLHHCVRKNADDLKLALDKVVVPIFCTTSIGVDDDKGQKLAKLLKLWETNKYFEASVLEQLKNPTISIANYQASLITEHASVITSVTAGVQAKYAQLQKQHQDFVTHLTSRIQALQLSVIHPQFSPALLQPGVQTAVTTPQTASVLAPPPQMQTTAPQTQLQPQLQPPQQQQPQMQHPQMQQPQMQQPQIQQPQIQQPQIQQPQIQQPQIQQPQMQQPQMQQPPIQQPPIQQPLPQQQQQQQQPQSQTLAPPSLPPPQLLAQVPQSQPSQPVVPQITQPTAAPQQPPTQLQQEAQQMEQDASKEPEVPKMRQGPPPDGPMQMRDAHLPPEASRLPPGMPPRDMMAGPNQPNHGGYGGRGPGMEGGPYLGGPPMNHHPPGMGGPPYMGNMGNGPPPPPFNQSQMYGPHPPGGGAYGRPAPPDFMSPHGGHPGYGGGPPPPRHPMHHDYDPRDEYYDDYEMDFYPAHGHGPGPGPGPGPGLGLPDITKPPPGFMPPDMSESLIPTVPYFDLPAGLIVPLVKLNDCEYKPLDPKDIRLPPPAPPSDALLNAVEMFYAPPSHERPRNSEGWEQLGLYEFFKAKSQHMKRRSQHDSEGNSEEDDEEKREEEEDESPPAKEEPEPPKRRYRESKSPPPVVREEEPERERRKRKSKSRSRSRSESKSPPPPRHRHRRSSSRSRSRSPGSPSVRKRTSPDRSPTPPSFFGSSYGGEPGPTRLDESNKGHQLLRKMGWGGAGLGAAEQGIQDPIHPGDVRDRQDMYKGIGISLNDPYESFRKSKGQAFINRMKARQEELGGLGLPGAK